MTGIDRSQLTTRLIALCGALLLAMTACTNTTEAVTEAAQQQPIERTEPAAEPTAAVAETTEPQRVEPTALVAEPTAQPAQPVPTQPDEIDPVDSLRDIDFRNDFTYQVGLPFTETGEFAPATVTDSEFVNGVREDQDYFYFAVVSVEFGDLDGDGTEEAVVSSVINTGGSGTFGSIELFRLVDGSAAPITKHGFGDRAHGGIYDVAIEDGAVRVWTFGSDGGACCPTEIREERLVLGPIKLATAETHPALALVDLSTAEETPELKFLSNTSAGLVTLDRPSLDDNHDILVEASAGQTLAVDAVLGSSPDVTITNEQTGNAVAITEPFLLPDDGFYTVNVTMADDDTLSGLVKISISNQGAASESTLRWTTQVEQTAITTDPFVGSSVVWPELISDQPGTSAANEYLRNFATSLDDLWLDSAVEFLTPETTGQYYTRYEVIPVTDRIVSVRFEYDEYLCCRPYPTYGPVAVVLDLATGQPIAPGDIVDLSRQAELNSVWSDALAKQVEEWEGIDSEALVGEILTSDDQIFDALVVTPSGVEFATGRGTLGGAAIPGTSTVISFGTLGDLLQPSFAALLDQ